MVRKIRIPDSKDGWGYDLDDGVFARIDTDDGTVELHADEINKYWPYVNSDDIEGISAWTNGKYVIVEFSVASGQGGIVAIWNEKFELVHLSNAEFGITSTLYDGYVYTLLVIKVYAHPLTYTMTRIPFGTMDAYTKEGLEHDESFEFLTDELYKLSLKGKILDLHVYEDSYKIVCGDDEFVIKRDPNSMVKGEE